MHQWHLGRKGFQYCKTARAYTATLKSLKRFKLLHVCLQDVDGLEGASDEPGGGPGHDDDDSLTGSDSEGDDDDDDDDHGDDDDDEDHHHGESWRWL